MKTLYKIIAVAAFAFLAMQSYGQDTLVYPYPAALLPNAGAANVAGAECYFDSDPGFGNGTSIPLSANNNVSISNFAVAIDALSAGVHRLYVRVKNTNGAWSVTNVATCFIIPQGVLFPANSGAANISAAEYFLDTDPGLGNGTSISLTAGTDVSADNIVINISSLTTGAHRIYVRVKNVNGTWSITNVASFYIVQTSALFPANVGTANISAAEYFLDTDPGLGNGTSIPLSVGADVLVNNIAVNISGFAAGVHRIYVRTENINGNWSVTNAATFYIVPVSFSMPSNASPGNITALEYFFDSDPGFGNGTMISITPTTDLSNYTITADISNLQQDTMHTLYVRALDGWSQTTTATFTIGSPLAVQWISFAGKLQSDNSVLLQWLVAKENDGDYFQVERSNDGKSFIPIAMINASENNDSSSGYRYMDVYPLRGSNYYRIRQMAGDGQMLYSPVIFINAIKTGSNEFYVMNNPAHNMLRVHIGKDHANAQLQLIGINGSVLMHVPVITNDIQQINISRMVPGTYVIRYVSSDEMMSRRFVKE